MSLHEDDMYESSSSIFDEDKDQSSDKEGGNNSPIKAKKKGKKRKGADYHKKRAEYLELKFLNEANKDL